jgi:hypothetical protein
VRALTGGGPLFVALEDIKTCHAQLNPQRSVKQSSRLLDMAAADRDVRRLPAVLSDWLLKVATPFGSESFRYRGRAVDFAGISHALHQ